MKIALALAGNPRLLLLDEPTAGLSPAESHIMTALLKKLDSAITLLVIEHDMDVAFELTELDPEIREGFEKAGVEVTGLFNEDDLMAAGEELEPDSSAALLVWENVWARDVAQKMRDAGGVLLDFERLPHEVVQAAREAALANA